MGKYSKLIDELMREGRAQQWPYETLRKADMRAYPAVVRAMATHADDNVREMCAEMLGNWGRTRAIPHLIKALGDSSYYVRQDALWSIEKICLYQPGALFSWLDLDWDRPEQLNPKVRRWWRKNREYIEQNLLQ